MADHRPGRFQGRVVVVTGGTAGIGRAVVERLLSEGACVVCCGRDPERGAALVRAVADERLEFHRADVTVRDDLASLYASTNAKHGRLDVVVNNAGNVVVAPTLSLRPEHWRRTLALNLDAVFDSCQLAIPHLLSTRRRDGITDVAIVNVASLDAVAADCGLDRRELRQRCEPVGGRRRDRGNRPSRPPRPDA